MNCKRKDGIWAVKTMWKIFENSPAAVRKAAIRAIPRELPTLYLDPSDLRIGQMGVLSAGVGDIEKPRPFTGRVHEILGDHEVTVINELSPGTPPLTIEGLPTDKFSVDKTTTLSMRQVFEVTSPNTVQTLGWDPSLAESKPFRIWTSGKFTVKARFVSATADKVTLEKHGGKKVEVEVAKLSALDQNFIKVKRRR